MTERIKSILGAAFVGGLIAYFGYNSLLVPALEASPSGEALLGRSDQDFPDATDGRFEADAGQRQRPRVHASGTPNKIVSRVERAASRKVKLSAPLV